MKLSNMKIAVALAWAGASLAWTPLSANSSAAEDAKGTVTRNLFSSHCIQCHGKDGKVKGKVDLLKYSADGDLRNAPELLQAVLDAIDFGEMPPEDEKQIPLPIRDSALTHLQALLNESVGKDPVFASTQIRRMNRFQYANAVQDLLNLKVSVFPLPEKMMRDRSGYFNKAIKGGMPDSLTVSSRPLGKSGLIEPRLSGVGPFPQDLRAEHGYDNQADHLSLSPLLMEAFFQLSRTIVTSSTFGPNTVGIWKDFFQAPPEEEDFEKVLSGRLKPFLTRAFRRPVKKETLQRYLTHALGSLKKGASFEATMKDVVSAVLASPRFLYLYDSLESEQDAFSEEVFLASRLSFFLWGSLPDEELLELARTGRLSNPKILDGQLDRILSDPKLKRFCDSFPTQWLQLDRIISAVPDEKTYPDFYYAPPSYRTTMDMMMEPLLLFETVLLEDRPVLDFIDANYTYRSARLRKWLGEEPQGKIGGPVSMQFFRQPLSDRRQGGMITNSAVMTMTSGPHETKPITRGAWLAGVIFNSPPPPPPADVPPLPKVEKEEEGLTLRQRFSAHRERADCAGCHEKLDPLGFALENFDPVGRWRADYENGLRVDSEGVLFRRHKFGDVVEFKDAILKEKVRFVRALGGHMLSFALGRELTPADSPVLDEIAHKASTEEYRIKALIKAVVQSQPFLGKSSKLALHRDSSKP
jgi:cytochrome c553